MAEESKWKVEASSRARTAHYWNQKLPDGFRTSLCGRTQAVENLQPESQALKFCRRCSSTKKKLNIN